jgi:hypothetical protein
MERTIFKTAGMSLWAIAVALSACSAEDDPTTPGLCALQCGGAKIAGAEMRFRLTSQTTIHANGSCSGVDIPAGQNSEKALGPVTYTWVAEMHRKLDYVIPIDPDAKKKQEEQAQSNPTPGDLWTPVAGVTFEPIITSGLLSGKETSTENGTFDGTTFTPYDHAGIVTPSSEWCTDSCGVATVRVWPECIAGSENIIHFVVHSGPVFSEVMDLTMDPGPAATGLHTTNPPESKNSAINPLDHDR